jgi:hypothetical protein
MDATGARVKALRNRFIAALHQRKALSQLTSHTPRRDRDRGEHRRSWYPCRYRALASVQKLVPATHTCTAADAPIAASEARSAAVGDLSCPTKVVWCRGSRPEGPASSPAARDLNPAGGKHQQHHHSLSECGSPMIRLLSERPLGSRGSRAIDCTR